MLSADDRLAIGELLATASYGYDARDLALLSSCLAEDVVLSIQVVGSPVMGPFSGKEAVMDLYEGAMAGQKDVRRHVISNTILRAQSDSVESISNLTLFATENGVTKLLTVGVYRDTLVRNGGSWKIAKRHLDLDSQY